MPSSQPYNCGRWAKPRLSPESRHGFRININYLCSDGKYINKKLIFNECRIILIDIDLVGKYLCADDILSNSCGHDSELKRNIINKHFSNEKHALNDYFHFNITMIPPGGNIDIFAKGFDLLNYPE